MAQHGQGLAMKIQNKIILFIIAIIFTVVSAAVYKVSSSAQKGCRHLRELASNEEVMLYVTNTIQSANGKNVSADFSDGLRLIDDYNHNFNLDVGKLGIAREHLRLELIGSNIDYRNVRMNDVDFVRFGIGYRHHLIIRMKEETPFSFIEGYSPEHYEQIADNVLLYCTK